MKTARLGIDFGTTTTSVSLRVGDAMPIALPIGDDGVTTYMPSLVCFPPGSKPTGDGVIVGEQAERFSGRGVVVHSIKRCIGCRGAKCPPAKAEMFHWCRGDGWARVEGVGDMKPSQIAHLIVREALVRAIHVSEAEWNVRFDDLSVVPVNVGCSATWEMDQRRAIVEDVARELGMKQVTIGNIVEEPILAGLALIRFRPELAGRLLIYDFGGGTFDVALMDVRRVHGANRITVLASSGDPWLGGDDIDAVIFGEFIAQIGKVAGAEPEDVTRTLGAREAWQLRSLSKRAKERLSSARSFSDVLVTDWIDMVPLTLSRERLEALLEAQNPSMVSRANKAVLEACRLMYALDIGREATLLDIGRVGEHRLDQAATQIDHVMLVGGVTKMPYIRRSVEEVFGKEKLVYGSVVDPIEAVCVGAGYPREPEHFSLAYPPLGYVLRMADGRAESPHETFEIMSPYEHHQYYWQWASGLQCEHRSETFDLPRAYKDVDIGVRRVSDGNATWYPVGRMEQGTWELCVQLDGDVILRPARGHGRSRGFTLPAKYLHPAQLAIAEGRKRRAKEDGDRGKQRAADNWISIYTEN
jgi:molecular chaperone DnaK (HSP70)